MSKIKTFLKYKLPFKLFLILSVVVLFCPLDTFADKPAVTGYAKTSLYSSINSYDLPAFYLYGLLNFDGTVGDNAAYHLGLNALADTTGILSSMDVQAELNLKEAYVDVFTNFFEVRTGKQIASWGLADGINPTDNINPRALGRAPYTTELDEQKLGVLSVVADFYPSAFTEIELLLIPVFHPNISPSMEFTTTNGPVTIVGTDEAEMPEVSWENIEGGIRTLFYLGNFSFSVSYLYIYDRYSDIGFSTSGTPPALTVNLFPSYHRIHVPGFDFQTSFLGLDVRGEGAFFVSQEDFEGTDPSIKNSMFKGVLQVMKGFFSDKLNVKISWIPQYVFNFMAIEDYTGTNAMIAEHAYKYNGQAYRMENGLSLYVEGSFFYETLNPEAMFMYNISAKDFLFNAAIGYDLAESLTISLGTNLYGSSLGEDDPDREYGNFSKSSMIDNSNIYLELRLAF
jgi:hypothetical protein